MATTNNTYPEDTTNGVSNSVIMRKYNGRLYAVVSIW